MRYSESYLFFFFFTLQLFQISFIHGQTIDRIEIPVSQDDRELEFPWVGGLNAPQVVPVHLNEDTQVDLLVFDRIGEVPLPLINVGGPGEIQYEFKPDYKDKLPPLNGWVVIKDYNQDGIDDYFTSSQSISGVFGVAVYQGKQVGDQVEFEQLTFDHKNYLVVPTNNGTTNLYVSWEDIPAIEDIDGDGDLDVLSFEPGGSFIAYYRNFSVENGWGLDSLTFDIEDFCWGKILESELSEELFLSNDPNTCSNGMVQGDQVINTRHSGSTIMVFDQDMDGDFDALIGDISSRSLVFILNGGTPQDAWVTEQDAHWPSYNTPMDNPFFNSGFMADINNDGHSDILAAVNSRSFAEDVDVLWYYQNIGEDPLQQFELVKKNLFTDDMLDFGSETNPAFGDVNGDGLMDLVIGAYRSDQTVQARVPGLQLLLNTGTASSPAFELVDDDYLGMSEYVSIPTWALAPAFGDLDQDGDVDLVVGEFNGQLFYWENDAGPGKPLNFKNVQFPYLGIDVGSASSPFIFDVNEDGLNDLIIGERNTNFGGSGNCGALNYFQNTGSAGNPIFNSDESIMPNTNCFGNVILDDIPGLPVFSKPVLLNTENGTKLFIGKDVGGIQVYGDITDQIYGSFTLEDDDYGQLKEGYKTSPAVADLNGDGYFECIIGNRRGGVSAYTTDIKELSTSITGVSNDETGAVLFPNPATGHVTIQLTQNNQINSIALYDMGGRKMNIDGLWRSNLMNLAGYAPGLYVVLVETTKGRVIKKLTISR